jgi:hypothetical protein
MNRVYHPWHKWEDHKNGFYDNCSGEEKKKFQNGIIEMFSCAQKTAESMTFIVENWVNSCEHNLTNPSMNQIAYIGQAACCHYCGAPSTITMETWSKLPKEIRDQADRIATQAIEQWKENNKYIQLCLNID